MNYIEKVSDIVESIFNEKDIEIYLSLNARFFYMPYYNLALIYNQRPQATTLCSKYIWENRFEKDIIEGAIPIALLYPSVEEKDFQLTCLYEAADTGSEGLEFTIESDIQEVLREKGFLIETESKDKFDPLNSYMVNVNEDTFYIKEPSTEDELNKSILKAYVEYKFAKGGPMEYLEYKKKMVEYIILKFFELNDTHTNFIYLKKLKDSLNKEEKSDFLDDIQLIAFEIITDFIGRVVSFDEVHMINRNLVEDRRETLNKFSIEEKADNFYMSVIYGRMEGINKFLTNLTNEEYQKMFEDMYEFKIVSFPLYYI